ncbi:MAG: amidohydrolase [Chloroflexi bacterium]|nr:amidohydrolase [Chloroflexota bacterium]
MPSKEDLKRQVFNAIDSRADDLVNLAKTILGNPEPGFREVRTSQLVGSFFGEMGIPFRSGLGLTGVRADLLGGSPGPTMALMGELDSLIVNEHPYADATTGAAHACGHHCQIGMLMGAAVGLNQPDVLAQLSGRVALVAVPAEEYIEIEYRDSLRRDGKIEFLGGKPELIKLGEFDDVDLAMMVHTTSTVEEGKLCISGTNNGTVAKKIQFLGKGSHAGGSPHLGINALNAATLALSAIHYNRETFRDADTVRVHPIITKGGEAVSAVPAEVRMETFVRGKTIDAIMDANMKVDRALRAGAMAVGAGVRIQTIPGYMPLAQNGQMNELFRPNASDLVGPEAVGHVAHRTGSTDMGDISQIMPAIHPYVGGATGLGHGADYVVQDYQLAVITAAKAMAATVIDLLADGASLGNRVVAEHRPEMTRTEYLAFMRSLASEQTYEAESNVD